MSWTPVRIGRAVCRVRCERLPTKQRPRHDRRSGRTYTPAETVAAEAMIRSAWLRAVGDRWRDHPGEVRIAIEAVRPLARSNPRRWAGRADLGRPDADNIAKLVCDALNGVAYRDDRQITRLLVVFAARVPHGPACEVRIRADYYTERYEDEGGWQ